MDLSPLPLSLEALPRSLIPPSPPPLPSEGLLTACRLEQCNLSLLACFFFFLVFSCYVIFFVFLLPSGALEYVRPCDGK